MKKIILVAGATGNLGSMISLALVKRGAVVKALVRNDSDVTKTSILKDAGIEVIPVNYDDVENLRKACEGVNCLVSALAGLSDVILATQKNLLDAALSAGVKRFIPSDFCTDYNALIPGENRNFDLRREFKEHIDKTDISTTSIFNGAFADILKYNTPILNLKNKTIGYWGDKADCKLDFTTVKNTAAFTSEVALQEQTPRNLHIASFQISPKILSELIESITRQTYTVHKLGEMDQLSDSIKLQRASNPSGEMELYSKWQQSQYLYSMYSTQHSVIDNNRYGNLEWTSASEFLKSFLK
ncbi:NmrA family NAD(P)-binding protein [Pedobacter sp. CFBP9032]|uniref:NmrA family NAD(P)-binding protein n=1 Tax=Pedobacter sp. CFBP9032 TaxID=3096539 RepID=UPI002A6B3848|nr:NmrA family NAD(P)-binding protein [Pedobacter sp. CFBP9032]MDY0903320.1 NmrA family NAD(P)-binding protein [Pedobacter sp. CFBP9032]